MKIFHSIDTKLPTHTAAALGTFNGLHIGHRDVIQNCVDYARRTKLHPLVVLIKRGGKQLCDQKLFEQMLEQMGVEYLICLDIDDIRNITDNDFFLDVLQGNFWVGATFCGYNFRFGKDAAGDTATLLRLCMTYSTYYHKSAPVTIGGEPVSSTAIKKYLSEGNLEVASAMLGRNLTFSGTVQHGNAIGRTLNTPTANIIPSEDLFIPRNGVYVASVMVGGERCKAICNIGCHPTVGAADQTQIECYLLDREIDLYSENITVELLKFLRPEQRFENLEQLNAAIELDKKAAEDFFFQN